MAKMKTNFLSTMLLLLVAASFLVTAAKSQEQECSMGDGPVGCGRDAVCDGETIEGCAVSCFSSCDETTFIDSSVNCRLATTSSTYGDSCSDAFFNKSSVVLNGNVDCDDCTFWFSSVRTLGPEALRGPSSSYAPHFEVCSCCDDESLTGNCPRDVPSCKEDTMAFCSDTYLMRTCKDWGNPVCEGVEIEEEEEGASNNATSLAVKDASTCSAGVDTVWCYEQDTCRYLEADGCTVMCGKDSCTYGKIDNSAVACYKQSTYDDSCSHTVFNQSFVDLHNSKCAGCTFWFSAVTTDGPFYTSSFSSSSKPEFWFCSCCDDSSGHYHCPEGVPSCSDDTEAFCSDSKYSRTCKDWGNPICEGIEVEPVQPRTAASTCSEGVDPVWCVDDNLCTKLEANNCTVICGNRACEEGYFENSVVGCHVQGSSSYESCEKATFNRSVVEIEEGATCDSCSFWFSAVTTRGPIAEYSYDIPTFGFCSCCDDVGDGRNNCPDDVPSCTEDPAAFCSMSVLGRTCQEWGNPICDGVEVAAPAPRPNATCSLSGSDDVFVCSGYDCDGESPTNCTLECYDDSCYNGVFEDSAVGCLGGDTCEGSKFFRSTVDCTVSSCSRTDLFSSALFCGPDESSSCASVLLSRCSCCSGHECPRHQPSCDDEDPIEFCNSTFFGRTCKDWGNPVCKGVNVTSLPPLRPAATCNLDEDIVTCDDGIDGCYNLDANNCSVLCAGPACNQATFENSVVSCIDHGSANGWIRQGEACYAATFLGSSVECESSCPHAMFNESKVSCEGGSCLESSFNECSCCDGPSCPFGVPECEGNIDRICASVVDGQTCACRGLPGCGDEHLLDCGLADTVVEKTSNAASARNWDGSP